MRKFTSFLAVVVAALAGTTAQAQYTQPTKSTTDTPVYYTINSYNRGGVLTHDGTSLTHVAATENSFWCFEEGTDSESQVDYALKNAQTGKYLQSDHSMGDNPANFYLLDFLATSNNKYNGLYISTVNNLNESTCIDANNSNTGCGNWHPQNENNDWDGTCWTLTQVNLNTFKTSAKKIAEDCGKASYNTIDDGTNQASAIESATKPGDVQKVLNALATATKTSTTIESGAQFYLVNRNYAGSYMAATAQGLKTTTTKGSNCIWKLTQSGENWYIESPLAKQYAAIAPAQEVLWPYAPQGVADQFTVVPTEYSYVALKGTVGTRGQYACLHAKDGNGSNIVSWEASIPSQWILVKPTEEELTQLTTDISGDAGTALQTAAENVAKKTVTSLADGILPKANLVGEGLGHYTYSGEKNFTDLLNAVNGNGDAAAKATAYNALKEAMEQVTFNMPEKGKFLYIKGTAVNRYLQAADGNKLVVGTTDADATAANLFYYDETGIASYTHGQYLGKTGNTRGLIAVGSAHNVSTFAKSVSLGSYAIYYKTNGDNASSYDFIWGGHTTSALADGDAVTGGALPSNDISAISADNKAGYNWTVSYATEVPVEVTAAGYATLWTPVALTIPEGEDAPTRVFTASVSGDKMVLTPITGTIAANTAVVVKGEAKTYNFPIATSAEAPAADEAPANALTGQVATVPASTLSGKTIYTLQNIDSTVGFYTFNGTNLKGFHASYQADGASAIKGFAIDGGEATGIEHALIEATQSAVYDLSGRRVQHPEKGIYVVNGKKVLF